MIRGGSVVADLMSYIRTARKTSALLLSFRQSDAYPLRQQPRVFYWLGEAGFDN